MLLSRRSLVSGLCFGSFAAYGQEDALFRSDTRLVVLHATVVDKNGRLLNNLPREAFTVTENGVPQQVRLFRREDVPVSMGLVIDNSASIREMYPRVAAAALALIKASHREDEVFLVNFNDTAYRDVDFTNDIKKLEEGLNRAVTRGSTAMRDAIVLSMDYLRQQGKHDKKVLMVITDGNDNMSSELNSQENLLAKSRQSGSVLLYFIGLLRQEEPGAAREAKRAITDLATASGGMAFFPDEVTEVDKLALQIAHEIRNQYIVGYSPTNQALDGSFRRVQVTAKGPDRPTVRTRTGYFATPEPRVASAPPKPQPPKYSIDA